MNCVFGSNSSMSESNVVTHLIEMFETIISRNNISDARHHKRVGTLFKSNENLIKNNDPVSSIALTDNIQSNINDTTPIEITMPTNILLSSDTYTLPSGIMINTSPIIHTPHIDSKLKLPTSITTSPFTAYTSHTIPTTDTISKIECIEPLLNLINTSIDQDKDSIDIKNCLDNTEYSGISHIDKVIDNVPDKHDIASPSDGHTMELAVYVQKDQVINLFYNNIDMVNDNSNHKYINTKDKILLLPMPNQIKKPNEDNSDEDDKSMNQINIEDEEHQIMINLEPTDKVNDHLTDDTTVVNDNSSHNIAIEHQNVSSSETYGTLMHYEDGEVKIHTEKENPVDIKKESYESIEEKMVEIKNVEPKQEYTITDKDRIFIKYRPEDYDFMKDLYKNETKEARYERKHREWRESYAIWFKKYGFKESLHDRFGNRKVNKVKPFWRRWLLCGC